MNYYLNNYNKLFNIQKAILPKVIYFLISIFTSFNILLISRIIEDKLFLIQI